MPSRTKAYFPCCSWVICIPVNAEIKESQSGEGRDSGECGRVPEDGEGGTEGSPGLHEGPVHGAEIDLCLPAQLPWRDEILSAQGQPVHSQQAPGGRGAQRRDCWAFFSASRHPHAPHRSRPHPWVTDAPFSRSSSCCCCSASSSSALPPSALSSLPDAYGWLPQ